MTEASLNKQLNSSRKLRRIIRRGKQFFKNRLVKSSFWTTRRHFKKPVAPFLAPNQCQHISDFKVQPLQPYAVNDDCFSAASVRISASILIIFTNHLAWSSENNRNTTNLRLQVNFLARRKIYTSTLFKGRYHFYNLSSHDNLKAASANSKNLRGYQL